MRRGTSFSRATRTRIKVLKWKKIPNPVRNNSKAIADGRRDVEVCHPRRNRRDVSRLLSYWALCQKHGGSPCTGQRKMAKMAAEIQRVVRRDLRHLTGSKQDEKVDDHLEKAMENYEDSARLRRITGR